MKVLSSGAMKRRRLSRTLPTVMATLVVLCVAVYTIIVTGPAAHAAATLLSQGKPTTASSAENATFAASAATDGNTGTRWSSAFSDPQWIQVDLGSTASVSQVVLNWEAAFGKSFQIQTSPDAATWTTIFSTTTGTGGVQTLNVTGTGRFVRMNGTARGTAFGYSLWEFQVFGSLNGATGCSTTNSAQGRPTTASSTENATFAASAATDGNTGTRWSSAFSDPQWIQVDLGSTQSVCQVSLNWEAAFGKSFQIQTSPDAVNWTTIFSTTTGTGGIQTLNVTGSGRFVRMNGTARGTAFGYSLWEFGIFTTGGSPPPTTTTGPTTTVTTPPGSGAPPASFWGDVSTIPAAHNVLEVKIINQTNGQYPDSQVFWSFNGQTASIAQQPFIDMPANSSGRMNFFLGAPNGQFFDFIEFTVGAAFIDVDTTRVDRFGIKLAMLVHAHDGSEQEIGENFATFQENRTVTFQRFQNFVPTEFKSLATDQAPFGIPSPGNDPVFQPGGQFANYFSSYAAANGDSSDTTAQIFGCGGTLAANPQLCAGLNRHVVGLTTAQQQDPTQYYKSAPANYYAQFWHQNSINAKQYGFPYDDFAGQSSNIGVNNPQYMVVAVGW
jgi:hypothetical protein